MTASFKDVARVWAAKKLDLDVRFIKRVEFESNDGYSYSECTEEPGETTATIHYLDDRRRPKTGHISTYTDDFPDLLEDLVDTATSIGNESVPPAYGPPN